MEVIIKECRNCFHRSLEDNFVVNGKDESYCNIKKKKLARIRGVKCKHYVEENAWKGDIIDD